MFRASVAVSLVPTQRAPLLFAAPAAAEGRRVGEAPGIRAPFFAGDDRPGLGGWDRVGGTIACFAKRVPTSRAGART